MNHDPSNFPFKIYMYKRTRQHLQQMHVYESGQGQTAACMHAFILWTIYCPHVYIDEVTNTPH